MFVILIAADGSGALAQDESGPALVAPGLQVEVEADDDAADIRFVASPVVQEVPAESESEEPAGDFDSLGELVSATSSDGQLGRELQCLAEAVYFESRGEPLSGQLAVARVIINRSASPLFPDDYCSVVTQRAQFSFVRNGRIPSPRLGSTAWARAKKIARIAHEDLWASRAGGALYFHANRVRPRWANRKTALATIDSHIFYR